jgi:hypothetical protein
VNDDFLVPAEPFARPGVRFVIAQAVMRLAVPRFRGSGRIARAEGPPAAALTS